MIFLNFQVFKSFLREYHIIEGYVFKFVKNESSRVVCRDDNYIFRLHTSPMYNQSSFQIKRIDGPHTCARTYTNNNATSAWISNKYVQKLNDAPELKVPSIKKTIKRDLMLDVSQNQVYRAKRKALEIIQGNHRE